MDGRGCHGDDIVKAMGSGRFFVLFYAKRRIFFEHSRRYFPVASVTGGRGNLAEM